MIFTLNAESRKTVKKSDLTTLRNKGLIPVVMYGNGVDPVSLTLNRAEFMAAYKKSFAELSFFEIQIDGVKHHTILKEKQIHPLTREVLHIDFYVLPKNSSIEIDVPLNFIGEPIGMKSGGMVDIIQRSVKVSCVANKLPSDIKVDISHLEVGESLHVADLPQGVWEYKDASDNAIVVVHSPKGETAPVTEEAPTTEDL